MHRRLLILAAIMVFLLGACGGTGSQGTDEGVPVEPAGPALIMFYTDN